MSTRRALVGIGLALALFCVLDRTGAWVCRRLTLASDLRFSRLYSGRCSGEVLVLGNSRGINLLRGPMVTDRLNLSVENISYNGMGIRLADIFWQDYLEHNPAPKLLILEITNLNVGIDLLKNLKLYQQESPRLAELLSTAFPTVYQGGKLSHLFRYNTEVFLRALYFLRFADKDWANHYHMSQEFAARYVPDPSAELIFNSSLSTEGPDGSIIPPLNEQALRSILRIAADHRVAVRLVIAPYLPQHVRPFASSIEQWKQRIIEIAGPEVPLYDYSQALTDIICFADPLHINVDGSAQLLERMIQDNVLARPSGSP